MPKQLIKLKTEDSTRVRLMYRAALREKMERWNCLHKNKTKQLPCRKLLLHIIKVIYAFPIYKKLYPTATPQQLEQLWTDNPRSLSPSKTESDSGSPRGLEFRCPVCGSSEVFHEGFAGANVVCVQCGHTWILRGGDRYGPDLGERAYGRWKLPTFTEYVDKKGKVVETDFPKIYPSKNKPAEEQAFQKILEELVVIFSEFKREWEIGKYNTLLQITGSILAAYMRSLPPGKGLPKKYKKATLLAVLTYYASVLSGSGLEYEALTEIFGVLVKDMDKIKNNEIEKFWSTKEGAKIFADLLPLISAKTTQGSRSLQSVESAQRSESDLESQTFAKIKGSGITKLGVRAFIAKLRGDNMKSFVTPSVQMKQIKAQAQIVENYFDDRPSELDALLTRI